MLEGRVVEPWVDELLAAVQRVAAESTRVTLDLGGVTYIDRRAAAALRALNDRGIALLEGSEFVRSVVHGATA